MTLVKHLLLSLENPVVDELALPNIRLTCNEKCRVKRHRQSSHDAASLLEKANSQPSRDPLQDVTPDTSLFRGDAGDAQGCHATCVLNGLAQVLYIRR